jgi:hypothetical protein
MSYIKIYMVSLLLMLVLAAIPSQQAYACSCIPPAPPLESMANSDAVFSGKVMRIDSDEAPIMNSADPVKVVFNVSRVWKGPEEGAIALSTARESASCGYNFVVGEEYLVYAYNSESGLTTGLCNRTMPLSSAGEDLAALGEGVTPAPAAEPTSSTLPWALAAGAVVAGLVLLAAVFLLKPRKG